MYFIGIIEVFETFDVDLGKQNVLYDLQFLQNDIILLDFWAKQRNKPINYKMFFYEFFRTFKELLVKK